MDPGELPSALNNPHFVQQERARTDADASARFDAGAETVRAAMAASAATRGEPIVWNEERGSYVYVKRGRDDSEPQIVQLDSTDVSFPTFEAMGEARGNVPILLTQKQLGYGDITASRINFWTLNDVPSGVLRRARGKGSFCPCN